MTNECNKNPVSGRHVYAPLDDTCIHCGVSLPRREMEAKLQPRIPRVTGRPWDGEFPLDRAEDMDAAAVRILVETMRAGRGS